MKFAMKWLTLLTTTLSVSLFAWENPCCIPNNCNNFCDNRLTLEGDWIYARLQQHGLNYAAIGTSDSDFDTFGGHTSYKTISPSSKWNSGFKIQLSYQVPDYDWEFGIFYTYIPSSSRNSTSVEVGPGSEIVIIAPELAVLEFLESTPFATTSSHWKTNLSYLDFDIANRFTICNNVELAPHIGVRLLYLRERLRFDVEGVIIRGLSSSGAIVRNRQHFQSYGIEGGLRAVMPVGCGLAFEGSLNGSLLYGRFSDTQRVAATVVTFDAAGDPVIATGFTKYKDHEKRIVPTIDYCLGLRYGFELFDMNIYARIDWMQQVLIDVNQWSRHGNLSVNGFALGAGLTF